MNTPNKLRHSSIVLLIATGAALLATPEASADTIRAAGPFRYVRTSAEVHADPAASASPACPAGFRATGAGGSITGANDSWLSGATLANSDGDGKQDDGANVTAFQSEAGTELFTATAICMADDELGTDALTYQAASLTWTAADRQEFLAPCTGTTVIGGGASTSVPSKRVRLASFPNENGQTYLGPSPGWDSEATNWEGGTFSLQPVAACLAGGVRKIRYISRERILDEGQTATLRSPCPRSHHVSAGGVLNSRGDLLSSVPFDGPDTDRTPDDGWSGTVENDMHRPQVLRVWAVCVR